MRIARCWLAMIVGAWICAAAMAAFADPPNLLLDRPFRDRPHPLETALLRGLDWLAEQQNDDGSWDFDRGYANAGTWRSKCGATAVALLAFETTYQTHKSGSYKDHVRNGFLFLDDQIRHTPEGNYVFGQNEDATWHAVATLAMCEAYVMTNDRYLDSTVEKALDHIVATQDEKTGGWAAKPGLPLDLGVTAWNFAALESGRRAYLDVPLRSVRRVDTFLGRMQVAEGAKYRRACGQPPDAASTTAGLLCRIRLGWKEENPALQAGVARLRETGPFNNDILYSYFATRIMWYHLEHWQAWRQAVDDRLITAQSTTGDEIGSWYNPKDARAREGGRLFQTALSIVVLNTHQRLGLTCGILGDHRPLVDRDRSADAPFPLD